jgi:hypothetical protein
VGNGGAEEGHDAVAQELVDRAFVAVHLTQYQLEGPGHELMHLFGVESFGNGGEPGNVSEQDRHLLAFAGKSRPGGENFLGEVRRRVALGGGEADGRRGRRGQGLTALMAELVGGRVARATAGAEPLDPGTALTAKPHLRRIVMTTLWTPHDASPQKVGKAQHERDTATSAGIERSGGFYDRLGLSV